MARYKALSKDTQVSETQLKILKAAAKLFARRGYHKTTIADLTREIGLTSGAIFYYYPTKEAILNEVVDWLGRGLHIYSDVIQKTREGSLELVHEIIRVMCEHYRKNPEATICLAALATEFAGSSHPVEKRLKEIYEVFVDSFARALHNHPNVKDPRAVAIAFVGSVQGIAIQGLLREGETTIDELALAYLSVWQPWGPQLMLTT